MLLEDSGMEEASPWAIVGEDGGPSVTGCCMLIAAIASSGDR